ncbi:MAG: ABC transporter substrate-binding protein [Candidatus Aminicenantes bacterium]
MWTKLAVPIKIFLLVYFASALSYTGSSRIPPEKKPRSGGVFRLKSFADTFRRELDPASPESFIFISEQIYDGLVDLDNHFNIVPSLAEYWEISSDRKTFTFHLRKGVRFHHGREISAEDVKYSLQRILDRKTRSPYFQFFLPRVAGAEAYREGKSSHVQGFRVLDRYTFQIRWTKPYISALYLLSMHFCKVLPKDLLEEKGENFFLNPSGTGPFKFSYWVRTSRLEIAGVHLERNEEYFGGAPYVKAVEFCPLYTLEHFLNGEIHSIPVLSERLLNSQYQIFVDGSLHRVFLGMSCRIPPLDDPAVRRAISFGINKKALVRASQDIRTLKQGVSSYIPSQLPGFFPDEVEDTYDLEKAARGLKRAGFSPEKEFPSLTLFLSLPRTELKIKIYRELRKQFENLGIRLKVDFYKSTQHIKQSKKPYVVLMDRLMNIPDPEDIIRPLFHSKSIFNLLGYENPLLDELLQKAEVEKSWTRRINFFHQIEEILLSDVPAVPLYSQQNRVAMQPYVRGVDVPPSGLYYLEAKNIWLAK